MKTTLFDSKGCWDFEVVPALADTIARAAEEAGDSVKDITDGHVLKAFLSFYGQPLSDLLAECEQKE